MFGDLLNPIRCFCSQQTVIPRGKNSLEHVMRAENQSSSFPIITIGDPDRVNEYNYRERCVDRLAEIVIDLQDYMGAGRLFIP
jgi:hypothetical protein